MAPALPLEVVILILRHLAEEGPFGSTRRLWSPLQVCRLWGHAACGLLYKNISLPLDGSHRFQDVHRAISIDPNASFAPYASLVRRIYVPLIWLGFDVESRSRASLTEQRLESVLGGDEDSEDDIVVRAKDSLEREVAHFETILGHIARNANRPVTIKMELTVSLSKLKSIVRDEKRRKEAALVRVADAIRGALEAPVGKLELVFNPLDAAFATGVPTALLRVASFLTDIGCSELCCQGEKECFPGLSELVAAAPQLKRMTLCSCGQLDLAMHCPQLTHISLSRCLESPEESILDRIGNVANVLTDLKSLDAALPNTSSCLSSFFRLCSSLRKLERLQLTLFDSISQPAASGGSEFHGTVPILASLRSVVVWSDSKETRRRRARRVSMKPELSSFLVDLLIRSSPRNLRSLDLSWTDVTPKQLESILAAVGQSLESLVLVGCKQLAAEDRGTFAALANMASTACFPRVMTELWAGDILDLEDALEELEEDTSVAALAAMARALPRLNVFAALGPSSSDFERIASLRTGRGKGADLLDVSKWEDAQKEGAEDDEEELGFFGDGSVRLDLRKLRHIGI
ncbi:hypothetical protein DFJ74DRAFT_51741 [Hyaloraphidium curvatum]|nr:hypothetical protein DFJ74DRAFT_51741 [Hyaloraphidium curvatum]